ncbi:MAG: Gmd [Candidatus Kaiserbacteria bacterium]|nr:Gmd [Candidatus Kaiserbacteria bacterium]
MLISMKSEKRALITGVTGQDGSYLAELLLSKGYQVFGLVRRSSNNPFVRMPKEVHGKIEVLYGDLRDTSALERAVKTAMPDEVYNLAAQSDVGISFLVPEETVEINYYGLGRLVNAVLKVNPQARIYQASTSEMFGRTNPPQNEQSSFQPVSPYAEAKLKAHEDFVAGYREKHGVFISSGILFNHESPRRGEHFVTRKITISLSKIKLGLQESFELGNLDAKRDWGFAGDYVEAMWLMLQQEKPDDYVIATGETHSVRDFFVAASQAIGIDIHFEGSGLEEVAKTADGKVILRINPRFYRPNEVDALCGDASKALNVLKWKPKVNFTELVSMMAKSDLEACRKDI